MLRIADFLKGPELLDEGTTTDFDCSVPIECTPTADPGRSATPTLARSPSRGCA